jgi:hypothetical protein
MKAKYEKMKAGGGNAFIDPEGYKAYVTEREAPSGKNGSANRNIQALLPRRQ